MQTGWTRRRRRIFWINIEYGPWRRRQWTSGGVYACPAQKHVIFGTGFSRIM
jgi:hypothetical protein